MVKATSLHEAVEGFYEVVAHCAAEAAILEDGEVSITLQVLLSNNETVVNADLAELVLDNGDAAAVVLRENVIDECRLACNLQSNLVWLKGHL
jgi:hypothetical protein